MMNGTQILIDNYFNNYKLHKMKVLKYENGKIQETIEKIILSISMSRYLLLNIFDIINNRNNILDKYILCVRYENFNDIQLLISGTQKNNEPNKLSMIRELNEELFLDINSYHNLIYSGFIFNANKRYVLYTLDINNCDIKKKININETNKLLDNKKKKVSTLIIGNKEDYIKLFRRYIKKNILKFNDGIDSLYVFNIRELIQSLIVSFQEE